MQRGEPIDQRLDLPLPTLDSRSNPMNDWTDWTDSEMWNILIFPPLLRFASFSARPGIYWTICIASDVEFLREREELLLIFCYKAYTRVWSLPNFRVGGAGGALWNESICMHKRAFGRGASASAELPRARTMGSRQTNNQNGVTCKDNPDILPRVW